MHMNACSCPTMNVAHGYCMRAWELHREMSCGFCTLAMTCKGVESSTANQRSFPEGCTSLGSKQVLQGLPILVTWQFLCLDEDVGWVRPWLSDVAGVDVVAREQHDRLGVAAIEVQ